MEVYCKKIITAVGGFKHLVRNYKNQKIVEQRRRYRDNNNAINNLNKEESLVVLDQTLVVIIDSQYFLE